MILAKAKVPHFMIEKAFDTSVARGVKRAYSSLDSFGLRTGMYLRRYPLLRTILFVYVVSIFLYLLSTLCFYFSLLIIFEKIKISYACIVHNLFNVSPF